MGKTAEKGFLVVNSVLFFADRAIFKAFWKTDGLPEVCCTSISSTVSVGERAASGRTQEIKK